MIQQLDLGGACSPMELKSNRNQVDPNSKKITSYSPFLPNHPVDFDSVIQLYLLFKKSIKEAKESVFGNLGSATFSHRTSSSKDLTKLNNLGSFSFFPDEGDITHIIQGSLSSSAPTVGSNNINTNSISNNNNNIKESIGNNNNTSLGDHRNSGHVPTFFSKGGGSNNQALVNNRVKSSLLALKEYCLALLNFNSKNNNIINVPVSNSSTNTNVNNLSTVINATGALNISNNSNCAVVIANKDGNNQLSEKEIAAMLSNICVDPIRSFAKMLTYTSSSSFSLSCTSGFVSSFPDSSANNFKVNTSFSSDDVAKAGSFPVTNCTNVSNNYLGHERKSSQLIEISTPRTPVYPTELPFHINLTMSQILTSVSRFCDGTIGEMEMDLHQNSGGSITNGKVKNINSCNINKSKEDIFYSFSTGSCIGPDPVISGNNNVNCQSVPNNEILNNGNVGNFEGFTSPYSPTCVINKNKNYPKIPADVIPPSDEPCISVINCNANSIGNNDGKNSVTTATNAAPISTTTQNSTTTTIPTTTPISTTTTIPTATPISTTTTIPTATPISTNAIPILTNAALISTLTTAITVTSPSPVSNKTAAVETNPNTISLNNSPLNKDEGNRTRSSGSITRSSSCNNALKGFIEGEDLICLLLTENKVLPLPKLLDLIQRAKEIFSMETNIVSVKSPVVVVGDIHGQIADLRKIITELGGPIGKDTTYLFLGDYVDRGSNSILCITLLIAAKVMYPDRIYMIRGNHETKAINCNYGFLNECMLKYPNRGLGEGASSVTAAAAANGIISLPPNLNQYFGDTTSSPCSTSASNAFSSSKGSGNGGNGGGSSGNSSSSTTGGTSVNGTSGNRFGTNNNGNLFGAAMNALTFSLSNTAWVEFNAMFEELPLCALIDNDIFCVHGGLSPSVTYLENILCIDRVRDITDGVLSDLTWSDPGAVPGYHPSLRGKGHTFGPAETAAFINQNNLKFICRAHQCVREGYQWVHDNKLVTVFSATNYCNQGNAGALMRVAPLTNFSLSYGGSGSFESIKAVGKPEVAGGSINTVNNSLRGSQSNIPLSSEDSVLSPNVHSSPESVPFERISFTTFN